jgi:hypothetical protein
VSLYLFVVSVSVRGSQNDDSVNQRRAYAVSFSLVSRLDLELAFTLLRTKLAVGGKALDKESCGGGSTTPDEPADHRFDSSSRCQRRKRSQESRQRFGFLQIYKVIVPPSYLGVLARSILLNIDLSSLGSHAKETNSQNSRYAADTGAIIIGGSIFRSQYG